MESQRNMTPLYPSNNSFKQPSHYSPPFHLHDGSWQYQEHTGTDTFKMSNWLATWQKGSAPLGSGNIRADTAKHDEKIASWSFAFLGMTRLDGKATLARVSPWSKGFLQHSLEFRACRLQSCSSKMQMPSSSRVSRSGLKCVKSYKRISAFSS
jgi:hypothetical protein